MRRQRGTGGIGTGSQNDFDTPSTSSVTSLDIVVVDGELTPVTVANPEKPGKVVPELVIKPGPDRPDSLGAAPEPAARRLQALIDMQVVQLGLTSWHVRGRFQSPSLEFRAQIRINRYFNQATIHICTDEPEELWDLIIGHELLHLLHDEWSVFLHDVIDRVDSARERELMLRRLEAIEEPVMNRLAEIVTGRCWPYTRDQEVMDELQDSSRIPRTGNLVVNLRARDRARPGRGGF